MSGTKERPEGLDPATWERIEERNRAEADAKADIERAVAVYDENGIDPLYEIVNGFEATRGRLMKAIGLVALVRHHPARSLCGPEARALDDAMRLMAEAHFSFEGVTHTLRNAGVIPPEDTEEETN